MLAAGRFPHLEKEIRTLAFRDRAFNGLCEDYAALVASIDSLGGDSSASRDDLVALKSSLELEILERLSRRSGIENKEGTSHG